MFVEERVYTVQPGKALEYLKNYEEIGMQAQLRHLPHMLGYYYTEIGALNLVIRHFIAGLTRPRPAAG